MEIVTNDQFSLIRKEDNQLYIKVFSEGFPIVKFNQLINKYPRINVSEFLSLKNALEKADSTLVKIGLFRPEVDCIMSDDEMEVKATVFVTKEEFKKEKDKIVRLINEKLIKMGVLQQFIVEGFANHLQPLTPIIVAEGKQPINGNDAIVRYIETSERKPTIREDGKADFFDMNFLVSVEKGGKLGEKVAPTTGDKGSTVTGQEVLPNVGKDIPFQYDVATVYEVEEEGVPVLRALKNGIVEFKDGKVGIGNHLHISGDVGIETGNIEFDGSVTINGIVQPGFSVIANKDISILGTLGVSSCESIRSIEGDIYIKGGVFGNNKTRVEAGGNIFIKHANECTLIASEEIFIGFYCVSSHAKARHIRLDENKGKIVGGTIIAEGSITCAQVGNRVEKHTYLNVSGFEREQLEQEFKQILLSYKNQLKKKNKYQQALSSMNGVLHKLNKSQQKQFLDLQDIYDQCVREITQLERRRKSISNLLKVKGEGAVQVTQKIYPNTNIEIKGNNKKILLADSGIFYDDGGQLEKG